MNRPPSTYQAPQVQGPPGTGGRVELRLRVPPIAPAAATYTALWATAEGTWEGELQVSHDGQVGLVVDDSAPPRWLTDFSAQLVRTTARSVLAGSGTWPRRLTRWRAAP